MEIISSGYEKCFVECSCGTEAVQVISDFEVFENEPSPLVQQEYRLAFYSMGQIRKNGLLYRLRHAWKILWSGEAYADMVILSPEEAMKLSDFIRNNLVSQIPTQTRP